MNEVQINPDRLAQFEQIKLLSGSHADLDQGGCAMEWAGYLAGESWSDQPDCVCPVIRSYMISLNDNWHDDDRQQLKPYILRALNTRADADTEKRRAIKALDWTYRVHRPLWLEAAGLPELAQKMRDLPEVTDEASERVARAMQDEAIKAARTAWAAWAARTAWDARTAWAAWAARDAWDARTAWTAWDARTAWAAWAARDARTAWAAWAARDAWDAIGGLVAARAMSALPDDATEDQRKQAGIDALNAVAAQVRSAELELLNQMIAIKEKSL